MGVVPLNDSASQQFICLRSGAESLRSRTIETLLIFA